MLAARPPPRARRGSSVPRRLANGDAASRRSTAPISPAADLCASTAAPHTVPDRSPTGAGSSSRPSRSGAHTFAGFPPGDLRAVPSRVRDEVHDHAAGRACRGVDAIVRYLQPPATSPAPAPPALNGPEGPSRYCGDSAEGPGRRLRAGARGAGLVGPVDPEDFAQLLSGRDPVAGGAAHLGAGVRWAPPEARVVTQTAVGPDGGARYGSGQCRVHARDRVRSCPGWPRPAPESTCRSLSRFPVEFPVRFPKWCLASLKARSSFRVSNRTIPGG